MGSILNGDTVTRLNLMFMVCVGLMFGRKNMQFHIICSFYYSISINTTEVGANGIVKPKNRQYNIPFGLSLMCCMREQTE